MSVMVSLIASISSSSCSVSNRFLYSCLNSIFFDPIRIAFTLRVLVIIISFLYTSTSNLMLHIASLWSLPMLTWLMTVTSVTISDLFVCLLGCSQFQFSLHPFPCFLLEYGIHDFVLF